MTFTAPAQGPSRLSTPVKVAAAVVVLVLLVAVVLVVVNLFGGGSSQAPQGVAPSALATTASSGNASTAAATGAPSCPANEGSQDRVVAQAPQATWRYQELVAYPVSAEFGPAVTNDVGRFCFQHSPTGALFMAANAAAAGSSTSGDFGQAWFAQALADGPYRQQLLTKGTPGYGTTDVRASMVGFKVLDYTGGTATIDFAFEVTAKGKTSPVSIIYLLTWQNGDWRFRSDVEQPLTASVLPDTAGYISWRP